MPRSSGHVADAEPGDRPRRQADRSRARRSVIEPLALAEDAHDRLRASWSCRRRCGRAASRPRPARRRSRCRAARGSRRTRRRGRAPRAAARPPPPGSVPRAPPQAWPDSDIGLDHPRVLRHRGVVALGQHLAAGQHGDAVRQRRDDRQVVLDHQDGAVRRDAPDQRGDALDVLAAHAGHRLVEQHHLRVERQRRRDLERALAAVGELARRRAWRSRSGPTSAISAERLAVERAQHLLGAPEVEASRRAGAAARCARSRARSDAGRPPRSGTSAPARGARCRPASSR